MENEKEVNPTQSGEGEVSSSNPTDGAAAAPSTGSLQEPTAVTVLCKQCGASFERKGMNSRYCAACSPSRTTITRKKRADSKKTATYVFNSATLPTKTEAKELLAKRGLKSQHIIDVGYDLGLNAAEQIGVIANRFYFANGIAKTLASYEANAPVTLEETPDQPVVGELSTLAELQCVHDFSMSWREDALSFDGFLVLRKLCKKNAFELGKLLDKDFEDCCQGEWAKFLPRFNPDTLPPRYTQRQMREWLDKTDGVKDFLLMASRNSMKSSFALVWALTLHLCAPDARLLLVSETKKLSAAFIRGYRNYWEVKPNNETKMQILFPEYCIATGKGSELSFESPMAHLDLIAGSARAASYESSEVGGRADLIIHDDPISNLTVGTETQIQKSIDTYDLLQKLREVLGSITVAIGTPWHEQDLYATLLKRAEAEKAAGGEASFASRIDPIVTVKSGARHKLTPALLPTLTPEDVESYLLPVRMPWRFVKKEIGANPTFALSQNFCVFPKSVDSDLKCQFDHDMLWRRVRTMTELGGNPAGAVNFMSLDRAWSESRFADFSCAIVGRVQPVAGKQSLVVVDAKLERARESEIIKDMLVPMIALHKPRVLIFEEDRGWKDFEESLRKALVLRNIPVPWIRHVPVDTSPRSKSIRVKSLELPIHSGRTYFNAAIADLEICLGQLENFDGVTDSNSHRKDDFCDALAMLAEATLPKTHEEIVKEDPKEAQQRKDREEVEFDRERRQAYHDRMHGGPSTPKPEQPQPQQQPQRAPIHHFPRGGFHNPLPGNVWRGGPKR